MTRRQAKKILKFAKPRTEAQLLAAVKRLGNTPTKIAQNLVKLGFERGDQRHERECPVCLYLKSLGFKSPYVMVDAITVGTVRVENPSAMEAFQRQASMGRVLCLGGYVED